MSLKNEPGSQIELYESLGVRKVLWTKSVKESRPSVMGMPPPSTHHQPSSSLLSFQVLEGP